MRVGIVASHPIQYQVPWYRSLASRGDIDLRVYYALLPLPEQQGVGFGVPFAWDIPLLDGYEWVGLSNRVRSPRLGRFLGSSTPTVAGVLARDRPDAVILTGWHALPLLQALIACVRLGIPRLLRCEANAMRRRPAHVRVMHRSLLASYHAFLAIGRANHEFYRRNGVPGHLIFPGPYFVDNDRFADQARRARRDRDTLRRQWGVPAGAVCFLYAGKLESKKRPQDLLQALETARAAAPGIHLLVVGDGALMPEVRTFAEERGLPVTFTGFLNQTEIPRAYAAADCLVLPSDAGETWGLVVNEAMACGLPAVVSDLVGCGPDLVEDGVTGRVFPCGDVGALSRILADLSADSGRLVRMGHAARERLTGYSVAATTEGTLRALHTVLGSGLGPSALTPAGWAPHG